MDDDLARFLDFERRLLERLSTRTEPFEHGTAFFDEDYRDRFNSNFLRVERPPGSVSAGTLHAAADRILGSAGFAHREVVVLDDRQGERLAPGFAERGYEVERNLVMVHRGRPDRPPRLRAEEVPFLEASTLIREMYRREPKLPRETVDPFTEQHGKYERVIDARFFVVRVGGELAGNCELYVDETDAQVENVGTLEEHRGRGVARAVVLAAVEAALAAGAERTFIVAEEEDWPKDLYARLGFDRIGRTWQFLRWPKG